MATSLLWSAWLSCSSTASREVIEDNRLEKMEVVSPVEEMPVEVLGQLSTNCLVAAEDGGDEEDGVCWPREAPNKLDTSYKPVEVAISSVLNWLPTA